ncbi:MAG: hypothetical protein KGO49_12735 [Gammaproteobacteria bacterium]|nr:hypothetical protein [Gammaproteobacteria bacterium]
MMLNERFTKGVNLQQRINTTFNEVFELPEKDFYASLDLDKLLKLKSALSDINSAISIKLALEFLKWVSTALSLGEQEIDMIRNDILQEAHKHQHYDIEHRSKYYRKSFVAEVKCRIPLLEGHRYGGAQKIRIWKDIEVLREGHTKATFNPNAYRFMVFLDRPDIRDANNYLMSSCSKLPSYLEFIEDIQSLPSQPSNMVYGIYVQLESK